MDQSPIEKLREIWAAQKKYHGPWTTGIMDLAGSETSLYFKHPNGSPHYLNIGSISDNAINALTDAYVLDETYRKAWKPDEDSFAWRFNPDSGQFVSRLANGLCPWDLFRKGIRVEPYKLNVYGQGGFFKTHKDTPHAENMFGSLVFTLPTQHQGGSLLLHHRTRDVDFHGATLLQSASPTSVAYVAFYSDVDHEVLEVTSGSRVTITFNLYFDPFRGAPVRPEESLKIPQNTFNSTLGDIFRDAAFAQNYKYLGFGLEYDYPKRVDDYAYDGTKLNYPKRSGQYNYNKRQLGGYLKGPDAFLYRMLEELGLKPSLRYLCESSDRGGDCDFWVLLPNIVNGNGESSQLPYLRKRVKKARIVWKNGKSEETANPKGCHPWVISYLEDSRKYRKCTIDVHWVTEPSGNLRGETSYTELGNEAAEEIYYFRVCLIVNVTRTQLSTAVVSNV